MNLFRTLASVVALVTALGGYMQFRYGTTSACEAAGTAIRDDLPKILDDLSAEDFRLKALRAGGALLGANEGVLLGVTGEFVRQEIEKRSALECAYLVGRREIDSAGYRKEVGGALKAKLDKKLSY